MRALFAPWSEEKIVDWRSRSDDFPFYSHMPPAEAKDAFAKRHWPFDDYVKITSVRNPYPRLVSLYRMISDVDGVWKLRTKLGLGTPSFKSWLRHTSPYGRGGGGRLHQRWRRFGTYSAEAWCHGLIDYVIRLEHLEEDLDSILPILGLAPAATVPHVNARPRLDWVHQYDARSLPLVRERYAWDLATFGYSTPGVLGAS